MKLRIILMLVAAAFLFSGNAMATDYVLIVNKANPTVSVSLNDAKKIFLGKKSSWDHGGRIALYSHQDQELSKSFTEEIVKKTPQQFMVFWKKALFTGTGKPPVEMHDDAEMKKVIAEDINGIGYISASALDSSVKQLQIN